MIRSHTTPKGNSKVWQFGKCGILNWVLLMHFIVTLLNYDHINGCTCVAYF